MADYLKVRNKLPSQNELVRLLSYNPETGLFIWKPRAATDFLGKKYPGAALAASWNSRHANKPAFETTNRAGYKHGTINGVKYGAHRVAWKYVFGVDPVEIDHINGKRYDNRITNLQSIHPSENALNRKRVKSNVSGVTGVFWCKRNRRWVAKITAKGRTKHLGYFRMFEKAISARKQAEQNYGFHINHGRSS